MEAGEAVRYLVKEPYGTDREEVLEERVGDIRKIKR